MNQSEIEGNNNIVIQGITDTIITIINVNGEEKTIDNKLFELTRILEDQNKHFIKFQEKLFNLEDKLQEISSISNSKNIINNSKIEYIGGNLKIGGDIIYQTNINNHYHFHQKEPNTQEEESMENYKESKDYPITIYGINFKMIYVEGGEFQMGYKEGRDGREADRNDNELHNVELDSYYIAEIPVTQELWIAIMGSNPSNFKTFHKRPVENISWEKCLEFLRRINQYSKYHYNFFLPSEAQWEFAARGGNNTKNYMYSGGNELNEVAWYGYSAKEKGSSYKAETYPTKMKKPNELGVYDMSGNIWEWCRDYYDKNFYVNSEIRNPKNNLISTHAVLRGGNWDYYSGYCLNAYRNMRKVNALDNGGIGFRLCMLSP